MPLQPLQFVDSPMVQINGDVTIHPSAAIAPGVILQAAPNSQIIVAAGVCIGMGVILNAYHGTIEIAEGVSLGPGVLIVGQSKIGANTCVGGASTIYNADLPALQVIPAGSLIGDTSRQVRLTTAPSLPESSLTEDSITDDLWLSEAESVLEIQEDLPVTAELETPPPPQTQPDSETTKQPGTPVFGKVYVNQLLLTLFPQGQALNKRTAE